MKKHKKVGEKRLRIKDDISGYDKNVLIKTFRLPNGVLENFFIDDNKDSVQIFPLTADNSVITVEQFRPGFECNNIELPGGGLEKSENPLEGAAREMREETGFCGKLQYLATIPYSPYSTGKRHMFVATNCKKIDGLDLDENEFLRVILWPIDKFKVLIQSGKIRGYDTVYMGLHKLGLLKINC